MQQQQLGRQLVGACSMLKNLLIEEERFVQDVRWQHGSD